MAVYQSLSVEQISQNTEENTSLVRVLWQTTQNGGSYNLVEREAYYYVSINGQSEQTFAVSYTLPGSTVLTLADVTLTVPHNDKGEATISVRTWMDTHLSAGVVTLSKTLTLDTIPRVTTGKATDALIGGFSRLALTKRNVGHTHSILWEFGSQWGYITPSGGSGTEEVRFSGESLDFLIPESFYEEIPDRKQEACTLTVTTYEGLIPIGDPQSTAFTVSADETVCGPQVSGSVIDICDKTLALTGDNSILVRHCSTAQCIIAPETRMGAGVAKKRIRGQEVEGFLEIPEYDGESVLFELEDSRGFTAEYHHPVTLVPYVRLSCDAAIARQEPVSTTAVLMVSGDYYPGSFGAEENSLSLTYSLDGVNFLPIVPEITENRYAAALLLEDMDYTRVYYITLRVSDRLTEHTRELILKKSIPVFDWGEKDFAFRVPVVLETPLAPAYGGTGASLPEQAWENLGMTQAMEPGVEYNTWQRWKGKTVYTMLFDTIMMPDSGCAEVYHWLTVGEIIGCHGCMSDGRVLPWGGTHRTRADIYCDKDKIYVDTAGDFSALTAAVQIFYTKE